MPREDRATEVAEQRRTRIPMGGDRLVLDAPQRPGFKARYVLDNPGRIRRLKEAGYEIARPEDYGGASSTDLGSNISVGAGGRAGRTDARLLLMEQKQEYYDEDQAAKAQVIRETERKVAAGKPEGEGASQANMQYVPDRGIKLERR